MTEMDCMNLLQEIADLSDNPKTLTAAQFKRYADSLEQYGWDKVYQALESLWKKSTRIPRVSDIEAEMGIAKPLTLEEKIELQAHALISRIKTSFSRHGYTDPDGAREYLGEAGWLAIGETRGWIDLCQLDSSSDLSTRLAQIRQAAKAYMLLPPDEIKAQLTPPAPKVDHIEARRKKTEAELENAKRLYRLILEAEETETQKKAQNEKP